jgi:hypothetical protein
LVLPVGWRAQIAHARLDDGTDALRTTPDEAARSLSGWLSRRGSQGEPVREDPTWW